MITCQLTSWDLRLKFLVAWKSPDIVETHVLIFPLKEQKSFSLYLLLTPETLFVSLGAGLIFWGWSLSPNVLIEKSMCLLPWEFLVKSSPLTTYCLDKQWFECWPVSRGHLGLLIILQKFLQLTQVQDIGKEIRACCLAIEIWQTFESFRWRELKICLLKIYLA